MSDFSFLKDPLSSQWIISAPHRANRPHTDTHACPFCPGFEANDEVYRVGTENAWEVRVIANKYPFTQFHEVIIHSPQHEKNFDTLSHEQVILVVKTYKQRYNFYQKEGQVYIFQNHGHDAGESVGHPHSQLVVIPRSIPLHIPRLDERIYTRYTHDDSIFSLFADNGATNNKDNPYTVDNTVETDHFIIFCPLTSAWPDEVWVAPKLNGKTFSSIPEQEISDLAFILMRLISIYTMRYEQDFPFNLYIYPGENWYLRLIPRKKILGGFEVGTGVMVNTQLPEQTIAFIKAHFRDPNHELIKQEHQADYRKKV